jgi:hypothetical protein
MEDMLDLYCLSYEAKRPVVCLDEKPLQLIKERRQPLPAGPGETIRYDYEYERNGTANIFLWTEPLAGRRHVEVTERRTKIDWALQIRNLLEVDYAEAEVVRLVVDNLNTHKIGSLYEAFDPEVARRLARRLEIHYTPRHGSWLNIAEIELSALSKQCLNRRIGEIEWLRQEVKVWERHRNTQQKTVDWQFNTEDARIKLKRLYPQFQV